MKQNIFKLCLVIGILVAVFGSVIENKTTSEAASKKTVVLPPGKGRVSFLEGEIARQKKKIRKKTKRVSHKKAEVKKLNAFKKWEQELSQNDFLHSGQIVVHHLAQTRISKKMNAAKRMISKETKILQKEKSNLKRLQNKREKETRGKTVVFNPQNVTEVSDITVKQLKDVLEGTKLAPFAATYVEIEKTYGINAIAMCAISALESGWGTSRRAIRDNNYTGFGVYSKEAVGINADSGEENLFMTAKHLRENYLTEGAVYYNGLSLQGINIKYCTGDTWADKVTDIGYRLMNRLENPEADIMNDSVKTNK